MNECSCSVPISLYFNLFALPFGGIAQLVERQLCKLDVSGSNPLASIFQGLDVKVEKSEMTFDLPRRSLRTAS